MSGSDNQLPLGAFTLEQVKDAYIQLKGERVKELHTIIANATRELAELEGEAAATKKVKTPRIKQQPLSAFVREALKGQRGGLTLAQIGEAVQSAGYQSTSSNFKNVLYQCLYNMTSKDTLKHNDSNGTYKLASAKSE